MRSLSTGRHHATFAPGDLRVVSVRDGYIDMPPTRLRDEDGHTLDVLPVCVPLVGGNPRLSVNAFQAVPRSGERPRTASWHRLPADPRAAGATARRACRG
ncbi:hypothetical protein ACFVFS_32530 [Kitasatospora sp. NPDC057692]|uniref:hypothetical protein n=1 Tax=Kitasatospora sp. NPDC057692 TaxID=3346215 RepID=UPI0036B9298B